MSKQDGKDDPITDLDRLHEFCTRGHKSSVYELLSKNKKLLNEKGGLGWTALHWAASAGHADVVELLCHEGANVNAVNNTKDTPLHLCAWKDYPECARILLKFKADKTLKNEAGKTPPELARSDAMKDELPAMNASEIADLIVVANEDDDDDDDDGPPVASSAAPKAVEVAKSIPAPAPPPKRTQTAAAPAPRAAPAPSRAMPPPRK